MTSQQLSNVKSVLKELYNKEGPERVGYIHDMNHIVEVKNVSPAPNEGFFVSPEDIIANTETKQAWASWHTHPNQDANLSGEDHKMFIQWPDLIHFIIGNDGVRAFQFHPERKIILEL